MPEDEEEEEDEEVEEDEEEEGARGPDMKGLMSRYWGKLMREEIFLWKRDECSKRFRWKLHTTGSCFMVSCLVDSW